METNVNNKCKAFTSLEQSEKLVEILPLESADMFWLVVGNISRAHVLTEPLSNYSKWKNYPCWSLAALLEEIPSNTVNNVGEDLRLHIDKDDLQYYLFYENKYTGDMFEIETELYENMIDACYEMILKLNELNLL